MVYIPDKLRELVIARAQGFCEYCQTNSAIVIYMEIDHIKATSRGGKTEAENLCLACANCNRAKSDIEVDNSVLFNPRIDIWHEHFRWDETGTWLLGLTPKAQETITRLRINIATVVNARVIWVEAGWHPPHFPE